MLGNRGFRPSDVCENARNLSIAEQVIWTSLVFRSQICDNANQTYMERMSVSMNDSMIVFVGSYAEAEGPGLYVYEYEVRHGRLNMLQEISGLQNPTFLDLDPENNKVYVLMESRDENGNRVGAAACFEYDQQNQRLILLNKMPTVQAPTCHIVLDKQRKNLVVSSYHGGMIGLSALQDDGTIGTLCDVHQHGEGSGIHPAQTQARPHSVFMDPSGQYAVACDLGKDKLVVYRVLADDHKLSPIRSISTAPGSGPRHFVFHPKGSYGYVINELNSTITAYAFDVNHGNLTEIQTITTLPQGFAGDNACADIHISPDGRYLYGSNRGHDSIAVFAIDQGTGKLTTVDHTSTKGGHPRNFAISPDGRFVLVANRDSNNIVTFVRDAETGKLSPNGNECIVSQPVCIRFMIPQQT